MGTNILTAFPFPFAEPAAQDLHTALAEIYPLSRSASLAAQKIGIELYNLDVDQPAYLLWADILRDAAGRSATRKLVENALAANPNSPRKGFFEDLLKGAATICLNHDSVKPKKVPETLLYYDDLTLPVEEVPRLILALEHMKTLSPSVCRVEVHSASGARGYGTAFRIAPDWFLTNHHVLFIGGQNPVSVLATFGYEGNSAGTAVEFDPATAVGSAGDDWAVVKPKTAIDAGVPVIALSTASAVPVVGGSAFVIQHPAGSRKRLAYARNRIAKFDDEVVHYTSDTQPGSSGSPVFDLDGKLIALHRAGGDPQEVAGGQPIRANEGVRISRVWQGLIQTVPALGQ
jgi:S1-C subfamily serine protease